MNIHGAQSFEQHQFLNQSPVKPIDITLCQEKCANIFGFDFDIKFCKMPESIYENQLQAHKQDSLKEQTSGNKRRKIEKPSLEPKFQSCLGISNFV